MTERVTLKPGDYVSTRGMTEEQYHAVARAFIEAGAKDRGDSYWGKVEGRQERCKIGWDIRDGELWTNGVGCDGFTRLLTPDQVIVAKNAGGKAQDTLTGALKYARDELDAARQHEDKAAEHRANHDGAMEHVRDMLPDGWMLVRGGVDWAKGEEMADPANWRAGDLVECITDPSSGNSDFADGDFEVGGIYTVHETDGSDCYGYLDESGADFYEMNRFFRFHRRPT